MVKSEWLIAIRYQEFDIKVFNHCFIHSTCEEDGNRSPHFAYASGGRSHQGHLPFTDLNIRLVKRTEIVNPYGEEVANFEAVFIVHKHGR